MHIDALIQSIDKDISWYDKRRAVLTSQKCTYETIKTNYPNASIHGKNLAVDSIWSKQTRMRLKPEYKSIDGKWTRQIIAQFPADSDPNLPEMRIFAGQYKNELATISFDLSARPRNAEITILDYTAVIPPECPKRNIFIDRIRSYIFRHCCEYNYQLSPNCFDLALFQKWSMLR
jgi:hypothetical protein